MEINFGSKPKETSVLCCRNMVEDVTDFYQERKLRGKNEFNTVMIVDPSNILLGRIKEQTGF